MKECSKHMTPWRYTKFLCIAVLFISRNHYFTDAFSIPQKPATTSSSTLNLNTPSKNSIIDVPPKTAARSSHVVKEQWKLPPINSIIRTGTAAILSLTLITSPVSALTEQQLLVDDVWRQVTRQYVDTTYNGMGEEGWRKERLKAVKKVIGVEPDDKETVYVVIRNMLSSLGDPYVSKPLQHLPFALSTHSPVDDNDAHYCPICPVFASNFLPENRPGF